MRRLFGDLKALGWWAPVRALYEVSTRLGITGRINRSRAARSPGVPLTSPFTSVPALPGDDELLAAADEIVAGTIEVFGRSADFGAGPDWHWSETGGRWPSVPWWKVPIRPDDGSDVKYVFELGRHTHLVTLAAAARTAPQPGPYITALEQHLRTWCEQNPPEIGIHWLSNLEIALRAVAWLQVWHLAGDRLSTDVAESMRVHLYHSGRHIVSELPYTVSSMRNNHLIGDAVGLTAIGRAFPGDRTAERWARRGDLLLIGHLRRHVHGDGSTIEDSLGYRAFVLDLLSVRGAMADSPAEVGAAARSLSAHLQRLGAHDGITPHFGDWDGGSAGASSVGHQPDGALSRAQAVFGDTPDTAVADGTDVGGEIGRISAGPWTVWLKCSSGESHGHADLLSVAIAHRDRWVVGDPGNGSYNRKADSRDAFRTSEAHNVLRIDGEDQRVPHRRFRWKYQPGGQLGSPFRAGGYRVMWGTHDAYRRLTPPRNVLRACFVSDRAVVVADWIDQPSGWELTALLHPDVAEEDAQPASTRALRLGDDRFSLVLDGSVAGDRGAWADDYDQVRTALRYTMRDTSAGPVVWVVSAGDVPEITTDGTLLSVDGSTVEVTIGDDGRMGLQLSR